MENINFIEKYAEEVQRDLDASNEPSFIDKYADQLYRETEAKGVNFIEEYAKTIR